MVGINNKLVLNTCLTLNIFGTSIYLSIYFGKNFIVKIQQSVVDYQPSHTYTTTQEAQLHTFSKFVTNSMGINDLESHSYGNGFIEGLLIDGVNFSEVYCTTEEAKPLEPVTRY